MWKNFSLLIVLLSLFLPVSGCSVIAGNPGVEQTIWILDSFADQSVEVDSYGSVMPHARLIDGTVSGHLGVNSFTGTYELSGDEIRFSQLASTTKADVPEAMEQETLFLTALEEAALVQVVDRTLTISDSADTVLMRFTEALEG